jgi:lipid-A-disaccharide synthase
MAAADAVVVTSGTATLEVMLYKKPMVIAYRMSRITHWLAKRLVKSTFIGLPNLIAGKASVPEFIQEKATPENIASQLAYYLNHSDFVNQLKVEFTALHQQLKMASQAVMIEAVKQVSDNKPIQK